MDGDGLADVFLASGSTVATLLGDGAGAVPTSQGTNVGLFNTDYALADLDQDGALDLVVARPFSEELNVFPGLGTGKLDNVLVLQATATSWDVRVGDFDGDGLPDVAATLQRKLGFFLNLVGEQASREGPVRAVGSALRSPRQAAGRRGSTDSVEVGAGRNPRRRREVRIASAPERLPPTLTGLGEPPYPPSKFRR